MLFFMIIKNMKYMGENMNDELITNMSMTCKHAKETVKNFRVALKKIG